VLVRTRVYIDGFNFYFAAFKHGRFSDYRWLDLPRFADNVLRGHRIEHVRYFTARVQPRPWKPDDLSQCRRQDDYLSALSSLARLTIHEAWFATSRVARPLTVSPVRGSRFVEVWETREKGSDVSLASFLLVDGFKDLYDTAVVVSDDSDLLDPVRLVRTELGKRVGVVRVRRDRASVFRHEADFVYGVRPWQFRQAQLPQNVTLGDGSVVSRPGGW